MKNDYMKRGYLLPEGCKDLIDVLRLKRTPQFELEQHLLSKLPNLLDQPLKGYGKMVKPPKPANAPPPKGEIVIPPLTTVSQLANLLDQKPYRITADLMEMGVFASVADVLGFETISRIAKKYGFIAKRAI